MGRIRPIWAVQLDTGDTDGKRMVEACRAEGVDVVPFERREGVEFPDVPCDRPVMFYCDSGLSRAVAADGRWKPGAYVDDELFRYSPYLAYFGSQMLNADAAFMTVRELADRDLPEGTRLMIRPDNDSKMLDGGVGKFGDFLKMVEVTRERGNEAALSLRLVVAEPKIIDREWRLFMVAGRLCTGSRYLEWDEMSISATIPEAVRAFAEQAAGIWSPFPAFVMDVCECDGELKIVELNGLNSSGLYAAEERAIVRDVTRLMSEPQSPESAKSLSD